MAHAQIVKLIKTRSTTGTGMDGDPVRTLYQLYTLDGKIVAAWSDGDDPEGWVSTNIRELGGVPPTVTGAPEPNTGNAPEGQD